jgi:N-acetylmuramoyl-L-alanine amidase-like protein
VSDSEFRFIEAGHYTKMSTSRVFRLIVIHSAEIPKRPRAALTLGKYFESTLRSVSAHICVDDVDIIRCVHDKDIAWAAPGANSDGLHIELPGFAKQTREDWLDEYGEKAIDRAAYVAALWSLKYGIHVQHLTDLELADKSQKGFVGHDQVSRVFKKSTHTDPGPGFPWDFLLDRVAVYLVGERPTE